jgi:hypothetical protein
MEQDSNWEKLSQETGEHFFELFDVFQAILQNFENNCAVDIDVLMNQGVSESNHPDPFFTQVRRNEPLAGK